MIALAFLTGLLIGWLLGADHQRAIIELDEIEARINGLIKRLRQARGQN